MICTEVGQKCPGRHSQDHENQNLGLPNKRRSDFIYISIFFLIHPSKEKKAQIVFKVNGFY
jgi:hypothetical protein